MCGKLRGKRWRCNRIPTRSEGKKLPKYVVKPTLSIFQNPDGNAAAWQKYLTAAPVAPKKK